MGTKGRREETAEAGRERGMYGEEETTTQAVRYRQMESEHGQREG